jgi:hypothetical protein
VMIGLRRVHALDRCVMGGYSRALRLAYANRFNQWHRTGLGLPSGTGVKAYDDYCLRSLAPPIQYGT